MKYFIIEGPDGVGKTTLVNFLDSYLKHDGYSVIKTRHPGGTPIGEEIRTLVKNRTDLIIHPYVQQILLAADYVEYIETTLKPELEKGTICIADRCNLISGMIYGLADGLTPDQIQAFQNTILSSGFPECHIIILHADMLKLKDRRHDDEGKACKFEERGDEFHENVNHAYKQLIDKKSTSYARSRLYEMFYPKNISYIDASQQKRRVFIEAIKIMEEHLG